MLAVEEHPIAPLPAPFPYFGGKSRAAHLIWERLGDVPNYCEPFAGSLAVLLGRPTAPRIETVNDLDGFICNAWRAIQADPEQTAFYADWPVNECDLHARHAWLIERRGELTARLEGDPDFFDAKIAGWWLFGICAWIGSGWCESRGPWRVVDGMLVKAGDGITRQLPHLRSAGRGNPLIEWFTDLSARLRRVRVCCGDWKRIMGPSPTTKNGVTGIVLDPPYSHEGRETGLYSGGDSPTIAAEVLAWAREHGGDPKMRIALCGYAGQADLPGWSEAHWKAHGGYANQRKHGKNDNAMRETIWFSPACLPGRGEE